MKITKENVFSDPLNPACTAVYDAASQNDIPALVQPHRDSNPSTIRNTANTAGFGIGAKE